MLTMNEKLTMMGQTKQMLSLGVWFTVQYPKPKSVLIVLYPIFNQIGPIGSPNFWVNRIPVDDRSEKRETFFPITT